MNDKIELLRNADLFSKLNDRDLDVVSKFSQYRHFSEGQIIFSEGSNEEGLFIIKEGEVVITRHKNDNKDIDLARFIAGECFGEMELLKNSPRNANAIALNDTTLLIFPEKGVLFRDVLQKYPEISARILHKLLAMVAGRIRNVNNLISEKSPWLQDLRRQLFCDKLTGLYKRSYIEEYFSTLSHKHGETTSLIILKPDKFKDINDNFGHVGGDKVLRIMAIFFQSTLRLYDIGVRFKGDEFAAILPDTGIEDAVKLAEEIRSTLYEMDISHITNGRIPNITASLGVATYPVHADDSIELTYLTNEKMFEARNSGGNRVISV